MELHQLRYVVAVARTRNFSRAAEQSNVSQPSLSQQIQKLENELGERLFERTKREARLTPQGEVFVARAVKILAEVDAAQRDVTDAQGLVRSRLAIGILPTIAPYLLPPVVTAFTKKYPGTEIVVHEDTTSRLLKMVHDYEIDFAVASQPIRDDQLEVRELFAEELLLALPPRHALARKRKISAADLAGENLIVMKEGHCLGDQVLGFCERRDLHPKISFRSGQLETIQAFVCAGVGISLVPAMATRQPSRGQPAYRSLSSPKPERKIVTLWPTQRIMSRAATEFLHLLGAQGKKVARLTERNT
ncbi:MAG TPA: LysR family transcriptional regulator [Candidatus Methylacidiphilales bacterium]|jgi:LysR family hydrogen peroxide-inducible transcriptional activator|nr:LysR family transcriptional regulator [Candidatus Methylacidiphilales bacterium]